MAVLPTNYLDDILAASMGGKRRFRITHEDGSTEEVTLEDVSEYEQVGSPFGSGDVNKTNQAVNEKLDSADVVDPALATVLGFAADAKLTGDSLSELNKKIKYQKTQYSTIVILDDKIASINGAFNFPDSGDLEFVGHFPIPMNALFPIQVRDNTNGTFKYIYMNNQGILESYNGGCEAGHNYAFACCYNIVF